MSYFINRCLTHAILKIMSDPSTLPSIVYILAEKKISLWLEYEKRCRKSEWDNDEKIRTCHYPVRKKIISNKSKVEQKAITKSIKKHISDINNNILVLKECLSKRGKT